MLQTIYIDLHHFHMLTHTRARAYTPTRTRTHIKNLYFFVTYLINCVSVFEKTPSHLVNNVIAPFVPIERYFHLTGQNLVTGTGRSTEVGQTRTT